MKIDYLIRSCNICGRFFNPITYDSKTCNLYECQRMDRIKEFKVYISKGHPDCKFNKTWKESGLKLIKLKVNYD